MIAEADDWSNIEPKAKSRIEKILLLSEAEKTAPVTKNDVRSQYKEDATLVEVMKWVERGEKPTRFDHRSQPRELSHYWTNFNRLKIEDGILYHEWTDPKTNMAISQISRSLYSSRTNSVYIPRYVSNMPWRSGCLCQ